MLHISAYNHKILTALAAILVVSTACRQESSFELVSPDGNIVVEIETEGRLAYSVNYCGECVTGSSEISMLLDDGTTIGGGSKLKSVRRRSTNEHIVSPNYRQASFDFEYNSIVLRFDNDTSVEFRVCNQGCAYRFGTRLKGEVNVVDEKAEFRFDAADKCWVAYSDGFCNAFQFPYDTTTIAEFKQEAIALTPIAIALKSGAKVLVGESDVNSYPGMMLTLENDCLKGVFATVPDSTYIDTRRCQERVSTRHDYIASTKGKRTYPWRVMAIGNDTDLPVNNMIYALGEPNRIGKTDWVKAGKVAWEWWNGYCLTDVDFKPGINTATYKAYIDFAGDFGLEYVILDEGWSEPAKGDIMSVIDAIDLEEILAHAQTRNVGVFLWAVANVLDDKLEEAMAHYASKGVCGFKVDFIDRDDQKAVDMVYRIAEAAARHHLMIDFHGMYKPTGLERTFPNIVNFEGVFGMEEFKWANPDMMTYDVTFPFIRMWQGAVDYTSGGYRNSYREDFRINYYRPMTQGTRAHQVATYVVFDQPLAMLCDSPSLYRDDAECTRFIASIPTVCTSTHILDGRIGEYIITAREKEGVWYVGGLTDWTPRTLTVDCTFLSPSQTYAATLLTDKPNSEASCYTLSTQTIDHNSQLELNLSSGGGFAMIITPAKDN